MPDYHKRRKIINYLKYLKIIANSTKFFLKKSNKNDQPSRPCWLWRWKRINFILKNSIGTVCPIARSGLRQSNLANADYFILIFFNWYFFHYNNFFLINYI